jgi:hypothetical protein
VSCALQVIKIFKSDSKIEYKPARAGDIVKSVCDPSKAAVSDAEAAPQACADIYD